MQLTMYDYTPHAGRVISVQRCNAMSVRITNPK